MRSVMGGCALLAARIALLCRGQAAARRSVSHSGWAVRAASERSLAAKSWTRSVTKRRSTAFTRPLRRGNLSSRAASTAACTPGCGALREYSIWWAAHTSSAHTAGGRASGRLSSGRSAGARRRYQRSVPSAMARTAAGEAPVSPSVKAASADSPPLTTAATARAAAASAGAPGAHGVLAKLLPRPALGVLATADGPPAGTLHAEDGQHAAAAAHTHGIRAGPADLPGIGAFILMIRNFCV